MHRIIHYPLLSVLTLAFVLTPARAQGKDSDKMENKTFQTSAGSLQYLLFIPKDYDQTKKYPLVVSLRGAGTDYIKATNEFDQAHPWIEDSIQARVPHFIMIPEPIGGTWGPIGQSPSNGIMSQSAKAVLEGIENLKKQYSLDTNRFIIMGFSLGGSGTYHQIELKPDYWAAAIPCDAGGDTNQIEKFAKTPIWHHQGSNDGGADPGRRTAKSLEAHNHQVIRMVSQVAVSSPADWDNAIQRGTKPEDVIWKNPTPPVTVDSLRRAVEAGARFIYSELTGGTHGCGFSTAAHNPLLAKWAFSKVKGGGSVSLAFKAAGAWSKRSMSMHASGSLPVPTDCRVFSLQGRRIISSSDVRVGIGGPVILISSSRDEKAGQ